MTEITNLEEFVEYMIEHFDRNDMSDWEKRYYADKGTVVLIEGNKIEYFLEGLNGVTEVVHQQGGGEGGGEDCEVVHKILVGELKDQFVRIDYNYYSHHGVEFDYAQVRMAKPVERMVTFYE